MIHFCLQSKLEPIPGVGGIRKDRSGHFDREHRSGIFF